MYKLVACDLDDTLLRNDFSISQANIQAIKSLEQIGVKFIIITGRVTSSAIPFVNQLGIQWPFGSFQGGKITDPQTNETLYSCPLSRDKIVKVIEYAQKNDIHVNLYDDEKIYVKSKNKWTDYYRSFARKVEIIETGNLLDFEFISTPKMILIDERSKLIAAKSDLVRLAGPEVNVFFSKSNFLEFTDKNATKGCALKYLAERWKIDRNEIMAIGDNYNDLSMLEYAGLGICMDNGEKEIKRMADFITLSNEQDGVAHAINRFILGK
ncbi:MAG: HAD family phosphatase [Tissierellales bacterium]|nr:HAD family phosphatase [Tissierellales bacterium]MBN2828644.1 HAD family phosphatase [Tissierellales bacterium]